MDLYIKNINNHMNLPGEQVNRRAEMYTVLLIFSLMNIQKMIQIWENNIEKFALSIIVIC